MIPVCICGHPETAHIPTGRRVCIARGTARSAMQSCPCMGYRFDFEAEDDAP